MVSFSCEVCNDTILKKKLDQHARQCYGAYYTCIDCSTTFSGYDYRNHTQCISEAEKYEKSLYKGNKKANGGKKIEAEAKVEKKTVEKKPKAKKAVEKPKGLAKYYSQDESLYKLIKKIGKDEKKATKDVLKGLKLVKQGDNFVLEW